MPWNSDYFPAAMTHLPETVRDKAVEVANALLARGYPEGRAISITQARRWAAARGIATGKRRNVMSRGAAGNSEQPPWGS